MNKFTLNAIWLLFCCYCCCQSKSFIAASDDCNELVCGSVVSKCLITQSCKFKQADYQQSDYRECLNCLGRLYLQCCNCVDMCPKHDETIASRTLKPISSIGDFDGVPELFETLTAEEEEDTWTTKRLNVAAATLNGGGRHDFTDSQRIRTSSGSSFNCTLIYLNDCTTNRKCVEFCSSMGANSFRWFHDGCCECVGAQCFNYGINESQCAKCPGNEENDNDDDDVDDEFEHDDELDYGEDEMTYN